MAPCPPPKLSRALVALGDFCARHCRLVLLTWLLIFVGGIAASDIVLQRMSNYEWVSAPHESIAAQQELNRVRPHQRCIEGIIDGVDAASPVVAGALATALRDLADIAGVTAVSRPRIATDRHAALITVAIDGRRSHAQQSRTTDAVNRRLHAIADTVTGADVLTGGSHLAAAAVAAQTDADTRRAEIVVLPVTLLLMCFLFGGVVPALVPVISAIGTIAAGMLLLLLLSQWRVLDAPLLSLTTVMGLGLAIDYSLLAVARFREERAMQGTTVGAVAATMGRAGRTVMFSALTVATALTGLWVFPSPFFMSISLAGAGVALISLTASLTLTPALLAVFGNRIGASSPAVDEGMFSKLARLTRRRPALVALLVAAPMAMAAIPFLRVHLVHLELSQQLPLSAEVRQFSQVFQQRFPELGSDVTVVARAGPDAVTAWLDRIEPTPELLHIGVPQAYGGGLSVVSLRSTDDVGAVAAGRLVRHLREQPAPGFPVWVTGNSALQVDYGDEVRRHAPLAALVVALVTFLLLLMMTGSILVPIKALILNMLSLGASFGALVLIFQDGWGAGLLGVDTIGGIQFWIPIVVFVFAFGLSMDYEVFLISRIKELHDADVPNDRAVELGLQRSGRIITSAAALVIVVFAGFAAGTMLAVKQFGLALAIAVFVDVTLVRCLLVPATMTLLGDLNWWAPEPLRRLAGRR